MLSILNFFFAHQCITVKEGGAFVDVQVEVGKENVVCV